MRRVAALLALLLLVPTACANAHQTRLDPDRTLTVASPDLVALKRHSDIPNCPRVASSSVRDGLPGVTLSCLGGGRPVDLAGLRGPMLVNFWASWCAACQDEMPALAAYARSQSQVKVMGVDFLDPHPDFALKLAEDSDVAYPLVADPRGALDKASPLPHISAMPMTVFVAADGTIAHIEAQAYGNRSDVAAAAQKYLGASG